MNLIAFSYQNFLFIRPFCLWLAIIVPTNPAVMSPILK
jgi:hypothetical protein